MSSSSRSDDAPTVALPSTRSRASWFWPGLMISVVALVIAGAALVVIIDSRSTAAPFSTPAAGPTRSGTAPTAAPAAGAPNGSCAATVETALEIDNTAGNRVEAVRIARQYGDSSPENHAYDDVSSDYYDTAHTVGLEAAAQRYQRDIELSCADDPGYRVGQMRSKIRAQYPDIDTWSDAEVLRFRSWVCPLRNNQGKPAAAAAIETRYGAASSAAYQMMDSSSC